MRGNPKVSILMPTHNDSEYISRAVESVLDQRHDNWELIIIDDGSTDSTPSILEGFPDDRITKLRQDNAGQLNALFNGVGFAKGDYITLLHSDDEFLDDEVLSRNVKILGRCEDDGLFSGLIGIGECEQDRGEMRVRDKIDRFSPATLLLTGGSNFIPDIFFVKRKALDTVLDSYIIWNMPYWLKFDNRHISVLKLRKTEPWYMYRRHSENYLYSDIGKFEVVNGCLRTVVEIAKRLNLPFLPFQLRLPRTLKMKVKPLFRVDSSRAKDFRTIVRYVINRYYESIPKNLYFEGLAGFFENLPSDRVIRCFLAKHEPVFTGKDARVFYSLMAQTHLPSTYPRLLEEASRGFSKVAVEDRDDVPKVKNILKMLNLPAQVDVT